MPAMPLPFAFVQLPFVFVPLVLLALIASVSFPSSISASLTPARIRFADLAATIAPDHRAAPVALPVDTEGKCG